MGNAVVMIRRIESFTAVIENGHLWHVLWSLLIHA